MELRNDKWSRFLFWAVFAGTVACIVAGFRAFKRPAPLTATEARCLGSWSYLSPDHAGKTCIVYHFASVRSNREEHYYLTSAWPTEPRLRMRGIWSIDSAGRMTVKPNGGPSYVRNSLSEWLNEYFDDGRQAWARPVLTKFYDVKTATSQGIQVEANRNGGGRTRLTMLPFTGDPMSVSVP